MKPEKRKYQIDVVGRQGKMSAFGPGVRGLCFGFTFMSLLAVALPVNAGYIMEATVGGVDCGATAEFVDRDDCVGQVTDPKNDAGGNPSTLLTYLNGDDTTYISTDTDWTNAWGVQGNWIGIDQLNADAPGQLPGTGTDGVYTFTVTDDATGDDDPLKSGDWTFTLADLYISYLVVTVKDGGGWSAYYYDLTDVEVSTFSNGWDTLGITTGSRPGTPGTPGPAVSHMNAAYIGRDDGDQDKPVPVPGTLVLLGLGLATLGIGRSRRRG